MKEVIEIVHAARCRDREGCPFDARRCDCWRAGCALAIPAEMIAEAELSEWRAAHS